jgi:hypothetical protein
MIKKILLITLPIFAGTWVVPGKGSHATGGPSFIINEDCEGTGTPSGRAGAGNWDSTTSPLAGAQSLRLVNQTVDNQSALNNADLWVKFALKVAALPGSIRIYLCWATPTLMTKLREYFRGNGFCP